MITFHVGLQLMQEQLIIRGTTADLDLRRKLKGIFRMFKRPELLNSFTKSAKKF